NRVMASRLPAPGRVRLAPMLGHDGRLKGDLTLFNLGGGRWWILGSYYLREWHMRWFEQHLQEGVEVRDISDATVGFSISGPNARKLLERVTHEDVSNEGFGFMTCRPLDVGLARVLAARGPSMWASPVSWPPASRSPASWATSSTARPWNT